MKIREAVLADFPIFLELNSEVQSLHAQAVPKLFKPSSEMSMTGADFEKLLNDPAIKFFIAEIDGQAEGYVFTQIWDRPENPYRYGSKMLYINHLAVRSGARGKGIGKALVNRARTQATELGISRVELDVWTFNEKAIAFFAAQGFGIYNQRMTLAP